MTANLHVRQRRALAALASAASALSFCALSAPADAADEVSQVEDLQPGPRSSSPESLIEFQGELYFSAWVSSEQDFGRSVWRSDGTPQSAEVFLPDSSLHHPHVAGDFLFYANRDPQGSPACGRGPAPELSRTDGTQEGTFAVADLGCGYRILEAPASLGNTLYFHSGASLVRAHGSEDGVTWLARDTWAESAAAGGKVFFTARDSEHGLELWVSDGTPEGTRMVEDIHPGPGHSKPHHLIEFNGKVMFGAWDGGRRGHELWTSDGTPDGTAMVKNIRPGAESSAPRHLTRFRGEIFFAAEGKRSTAGLYRTDGTAAGTTLIKSGFDYPYSTTLSEAEVIGNRLFFLGDHERSKVALWTTGGTRSSTRLVSSLRTPGPDQPPTEFTEAGGTLYFVGDDRQELYRSDGTPDGTHTLHEPSTGGSFRPTGLIEFQNRLFFAGDGPEGRELWTVRPEAR